MRRTAFALFVTAVLTSVALAGCASPASAPSAPKSETSASATPKQDAYVKTYGTFTAFTASGNGAGIVKLPANVRAGLVTLNLSGAAAANFEVDFADAQNKSAGVGYITSDASAHDAPFAFGVDLIAPVLHDRVRTFLVSGKGKWTMQIAPMDTAPPLPLTGKGLGVFKYDGKSALWKIQNHGPADSNFIFSQTDPDGIGVGIDEFGNYSGTTTVDAGPSIVEIDSAGTWTITPQ
ncbi:MAG: hypothetical protein JWR53_1036 [Glaciihabitans sp.]|nr:hypothetical protein [Glaciihabitans sp.]